MSGPDGKIKLWIRRRLPERFKRILRLIRLAAAPAPGPAPELPQELLQNCVLLASRLVMLDRLPKNAVMAEVGVLHGAFSTEILHRCVPKELHLIDVTFATLNADVRRDDRVALRETLSVSALANYDDEFFDFIYIDGDHSYAAVKADIAAAASKVKIGGVLAFNDFARMVRPGFGVLGVHQAVCEFAAEHRWPFVYFCLNGEALYDVALQRPR